MYKEMTTGDDDDHRLFNLSVKIGIRNFLGKSEFNKWSCVGQPKVGCFEKKLTL